MDSTTVHEPPTLIEFTSIRSIKKRLRDCKKNFSNKRLNRNMEILDFTFPFIN